MDGVTIALLLFVLACIFLYFRREKTNKRLPPLSHGTLANLYRLLTKKRNARMLGEALEYGDIYRVQFGVDVIVLNCFEAAQEALINQGDIFSGRQKDTFSKLLGNDAGIAGTDGPLWQEHRRLMLQVLRDFGMGKSLANDLVQDEVSALTELISNANGSPIITQDLFSSATNNVIARLIFGERSGTDDVHFKEFTQHLNSMMEMCLANVIPFLFPWLLKVSFIKSRIPMFYHNMGINNYIQKKIEQQSLSFQAMNPPPTEINQATNICEAFLIEQANQSKSNPGAHTFTDWQIIRNMAELFTAGTDTSASTLNWAMLLLATHPDVQRRVHEEIEDKVGRQRLPSMSDRPQLPFASAVMDEVMRYSSIFPSNVAHRTLKDTIVLGYDIPANTLVQTNIYGIHHDPKHWAKPYEFYPEHFLSEDGSYRPSKFLMPFSIGKRSCLGESLARMEYFIAFVGLMQKFEVQLADPNVDMEALLDGSMRIIRHPLPHKIIFLSLDNCDEGLTFVAQRTDIRSHEQ